MSKVLCGKLMLDVKLSSVIISADKTNLEIVGSSDAQDKTNITYCGFNPEELQVLLRTSHYSHKKKI